MSQDGLDLLAALNPPGVAGADEDIRFYGSNQRETLAHYRLLFPSLVSYRGGLFVERAFDKQFVDQMFDQAAFDEGESPIAIAEETINAVGLLNEDEAEFDVAIAQANAAAIGWVWRRWIKDMYGLDVEIMASVESADACYITFRSGADRA